MKKILTAIMLILFCAPFGIAVGALKVDLQWVETDLSLNSNGSAIIVYKMRYRILSGRMHGFYFEGFGNQTPLFDLPSCKAIDFRGREYPLSIERLSSSKYDVLLAGGRDLGGEVTFILVYAGDLTASGNLAATVSPIGEKLAVLNWSTVGWDEPIEHYTLSVHYPIAIEKDELTPQEMEQFTFRTEKWMNERYLISYYAQPYKGKKWLSVRLHWKDVPSGQGLRVQQYIDAKYFTLAGMKSPAPAPVRVIEKPESPDIDAKYFNLAEMKSPTPAPVRVMKKPGNPLQLLLERMPTSVRHPHLPLIEFIILGILICIVILLVSKHVKKRRDIMQAYVVKSWEVNEEINKNGNYVEIKGRAPGLISWILALIGIEPTVAILISEKVFVFESGSWGGRFYKEIPLSKISSIFYGYSKPWKGALALFIILGVLLGIPTYGIMTIIGGLVALLYYFLNKKLILGIFEVGGIASGIEIKRSVIEGKKLDEKDAERVGNILRQLIEAYSEKK